MSATCIGCRRAVGAAGDPLVAETDPGHPHRYWCSDCARHLGIGSNVPALDFCAWVRDPRNLEALARFRAWVRRQTRPAMVIA